MNLFTPVKSADRVFDIFELLAAHKDGIPIRELGKQLHIADSSIHALVHTMLQRGYLKMGVNRKIQLGAKFNEFANMASMDSLIDYAKPVMKEIKQRINENVHLAVLQGLDVKYIAYEESTHPIRYHIDVGRVHSAHVTGVGKMLLSSISNEQIRKLYKHYKFDKLTPTTIDNVDQLVEELDRIRECRYSIDDGESYEGGKCFAAPIYNASSKMVASISISIPFVKNRSSVEDREMITAIQDAANRITLRLAEID